MENSRKAMSPRLSQIHDIFSRSIDVKKKFLAGNSPEVLVAMSDVITSSLRAGGKLLLCGNGGSAADAQHLAAELLIRLHPHVSRGSLPALSLAMDSSTLTACGNDFSFDDIFSRPLSSLGKRGDVLLGITTSGNSRNILKALQKAREMEIATLGFLGGSGGEALSLCDYAVVVPSSETARIQESHITAGHALMEIVEDQLQEISLS